ncbi:hypothetical protein [Paracoccus sp. KR1-242]|uniref:hypothetical protein n=1 Tax=Paracoccus sp. KR1-242 TaxID=3410028 RepID=UPI003C0A65D4
MTADIPEDDWMDVFFREGTEQRAVHFAKQGDPTLLIDLIESGEAIGPLARSFLVSHLRRNAGRRNLWLDGQRRLEAANSVWLLARMNGWSRGRAMREYLDEHPDLDMETLRTWLREAGVGKLDGLPPIPEIPVKKQKG